MQHVRIVNTYTQPDTERPHVLRDEWLPRLGPTAYLAGCMLAELVDGSHELDDEAWGKALGVTPAKFKVSLQRLANFNLGVYWPDTKQWVFYSHWIPPHLVKGGKYSTGRPAA
jgi:hypothetical protein